MKQIRETEEDRIHQMAAAFEIEKAYGVHVETLPTLSVMDWKMKFVDGKQFGWGEFKWRGRVPHRQYPDVFLEPKKWYGSGGFSELLEKGERAWYWVQWKDFFGYIDARRIDSKKTRMGGNSRQDGEDGDRGMMIVIPVENFAEVLVK